MTPVAASPCIAVCVVDPKTSFCIGCGRTSDEIANWPSLDNSARARIQLELPTRLTAMTSRQVRGQRRSRKDA